MTILYIDCETTGLDYKTKSIVQLSGIITNGKREKPFSFNLRPYKHDTITEEAFSKTGLSNETIYSYPDQKEAYKSFLDLLQEFGVGSSYNQKAFWVGYNCSFDMDFVRDWFSFNGNSKFGYYFWYPGIDVMTLAGFYLITERKNLKNFQQSTVYSYLFNEELTGAHDALVDINATRRIMNFIYKKLKNPPIKEEKDPQLLLDLTYDIPEDPQLFFSFA